MTKEQQKAAKRATRIRAFEIEITKGVNEEGYYYLANLIERWKMFGLFPTHSYRGVSVADKETGRFYSYSNSEMDSLWRTEYKTKAEAIEAATKCREQWAKEAEKFSSILEAETVKA